MRSDRGGDGERRWLRNAGLAMQMGLSLVAGIVVGWGIGYWLDRLLGTEPWLMVLFTLLGIASGFLEMFRIAQRLSQEGEDPPRGCPGG
ncbi:MAG: AtpZ/AtpI family protein [Armatimonadetes bacterium]|nr:AtpZ/AtpI family protein [Armatimonadota bacterium]